MDYTNCIWSETAYEAYREELRTLSEEKYRLFQAKLVPKLKSELLGVRAPVLKKLSRQICKGDWPSFLKLCRSEYYEEIMVEGLVRAGARVSYEERLALIDGFLPKIDNWALCDSFCGAVKIARKDKTMFFEKLLDYLLSQNPWEQRVGLVISLGDYLTEDFVDEVLARCDGIHSGHYYVRMAQAWLVSAAYAKFPEKGQAYLERCSLDDWTFKKAIQKTRESYRVGNERKVRLKELARSR